MSLNATSNEKIITGLNRKTKIPAKSKRASFISGNVLSRNKAYLILTGNLPIRNKNFNVEKSFKTRLIDVVGHIQPRLNIQPDDKILEEKKGVINKVDPDFVKVKLDDNLLINFPVIFFSDKNLLKYGQQIKYQIKQDINGRKYQEFVEDIDIQPSKYKEKILEALNSF
jgi:hypothetical protein